MIKRKDGEFSLPPRKAYRRDISFYFSYDKPCGELVLGKDCIKIISDSRYVLANTVRNTWLYLIANLQCSWKANIFERDCSTWIFCDCFNNYRSINHSIKGWVGEWESEWVGGWTTIIVFIRGGTLHSSTVRRLITADYRWADSQMSSSVLCVWYLQWLIIRLMRLFYQSTRSVKLLSSSNGYCVSFSVHHGRQWRKRETQAWH